MTTARERDVPVNSKHTEACQGDRVRCANLNSRRTLLGNITRQPQRKSTSRGEQHEAFAAEVRTEIQRLSVRVEVASHDTTRMTIELADFREEVNERFDQLRDELRDEIDVRFKQNRDETLNVDAQEEQGANPGRRATGNERSTTLSKSSSPAVSKFDWAGQPNLKSSGVP